MKQIWKLSPMIMLLTLMFSVLTVDLSAQGFISDAVARPTDGNGVVWAFEVEVDSLENYTSKAFSLSPYDADDFSEYHPLHFGKVASSADGTPRVFVYIQGTYGDGNWFTVDTVAVADSVETYNTGTLDLNAKKCAAYRVVFDGITGYTDNRLDTVYKLSLYAYRKDPDLITR